MMSGKSDAVVHAFLLFFIIVFAIFIVAKTGKEQVVDKRTFKISPLKKEEALDQ